MRRKKNQPERIGTKELKCSKCGKIVVVNYDSVSVICGRCTNLLDIENDKALSAELAFEETLSKQQWEELIAKRVEARESRINEKRNVDLDDVVKKRDKRKKKEKKFIEDSVKKVKQKKESRKKNKKEQLNGEKTHK